MLQIQEIKEGEYASFQAYMDSLLKAIDVIINPHMFLVDGVNYMVCKEGPVIAISEKVSDDKHMSYCVLMDDTGEKLERVVTEDYLLEIFLDGEIPIVAKTDLGSLKQEQFFITWAQENQPHDWLHYYVCNDDESCEMEYQYDITRVKSYLEGYMYYLNNKNPDLITINEKSKLLGLIDRVKKNSFIQLSDGSGYGKVLFEYSNQLALLRAKVLSFNDIKAQAREMGLETTVPTDMMNAFFGKHEKVKTLELISKEYNKIARSKGV